MWDTNKMILVTNNNRVFEKYKDQVKVILKDSYEKVLIKSRDLVYTGHSLLTHPQASSLKPNQTPYRSVLLYTEVSDDEMKSILLIEKCIENYKQWQKIAKTPVHYPVSVEDDFKTIDLSVIDNIMQRF